MPVQIDSEGRRFVQADAEVPGSAEAVWDAVATGSGISSWFVPSEMDQRPGGRSVSHFASDGTMDSEGTIAVWDPPRRYVIETRDESSAVETEWTVEPLADACRVKVVHRWMSDNDSLDPMFEGHSEGWRAFFRLLRLYLASFAGQDATTLQFLAVSHDSVGEAWETLVAPLGIEGAVKEQRFSTSADAPSLSGAIEHVGTPEYPEVVLRLEKPAAGFAHFFAMSMAGQVFLSTRFYLFGGAEGAAGQLESNWRDWLQSRFPPRGSEGSTTT